MRLNYRWFVMVCLLLLLIGGVAFACPPAASYHACAPAAAAYGYSYPAAVYPVAVQLVVPYTPVVTVPAQAVQVQQQVVPQAAPAPQPQAQAEMPVAAPVVVQRSVQAVYAAPVAAVVAYSAAVSHQSYAAAAGVHGYGAQRGVVVQRAAVAKPARVVIQNGVQRRGILGRIADRIRARRAGGGVPSQTIIVR